MLKEFFLRPIYDYFMRPNTLLQILDPKLREEEQERQQLMRVHWPA